jgi:hypothetical protein
MKTLKVNVKVLNTVKNVLVYLLVAAQFGVLAYFLFAGVSSAFGMRINVFSAVTLSLSILSMAASSLYKIIFASLLGVFYFVFAFRMAKAAINSVQHLKSSLKNIELNTKTVDVVMLIFENFGNCLYFPIAFLVISRMVSSYAVPKGVIAVFVLFAVLDLVARFVIELIANNDLFDAIYKQIVCHGIILVATSLLIANISGATVGSVFNSFKAFGAIVVNSGDVAAWAGLIDQFAVNAALVIILQVFALATLRDLLSMRSYRLTDGYAVRRDFIFTIVIAVAHVILSAVVASSAGFDLVPVIIAAVMKYLSVVAFAGVANFAFNFPLDFVLPGNDSPAEESQAEAENSAEADNATESQTA